MSPILPGAPAVEPQADWRPVQPFPVIRTVRSFVSGDPTGSRFRIAYFQRAGDGAVVGRAWFGPHTEGPPEHVHGGAVAAVLDEAMGAAAWVAGHPSIAASITVDFRAMVPLGLDATLEASVIEVNGRKVTTRARLIDAAGVVLAESGGLFIIIDPAKIAEYL